MCEKLYYKDQYIRQFEATVLSNEDIEGKTAVVLDKTAFFPEGGGQRGDSGFINGIKVLDTKIIDGNIYHFVEQSLAVGEKVTAKIDWNSRFARMQNHTGEHLVSGILHSLYGIDNVGFALYDGYITFDTSLPLDREMVQKAEKMANDAIYLCKEVRTYFPDAETLKTLKYRSKKEITQEIRIAEIEDYDRTACCAPMVKNTGEIGIIKLVDYMNFKGGSRVWAVCGSWAVDYFDNLNQSAARISAMLCAKKEEIADSVEALKQKNKDLEHQILTLKEEICLPVINSVTSSEKVALFGDFDPDQQRFIANEVSKKCKTVIVLKGNDQTGYSYTLKTDPDRLTDTLADLNRVLLGRGGGRNGMAQGTIRACKEKIEEYFKA